jgi:hypothetical protein
MHHGDFVMFKLMLDIFHLKKNHWFQFLKVLCESQPNSCLNFKKNVGEKQPTYQYLFKNYKLVLKVVGSHKFDNNWFS